MRSRRTFVRGAIAALPIAVLLVVGCVPRANTGIPPVPTEATLWWATGDSIFAGAQTYFGAPSYMNNTFNAARAGGTITKITLNGEPQPTVPEHFERLVERFGVPERVVVHSGAADMLVKAVHPQGAWHVDADSIVAAASEFDDWMYSIGVEQVMWVGITPHTEWAATAPMNGMRRQVNDGYRNAFEDRFIDCETAITGSPNRVWMKREYEVYDGVHLNNLGARVLAACISEALELPPRD